MEANTYNCPICGSAFAAQDANGDINPAEVQAAVEACNNALEEAMSDISTSIENIRPDACNAIRSYNKDFGYKFDDVKNSIDDIKTAASGLLDDLVRQAQEVHDRKQQIYNEEAKGKATTCYYNCKAAAEAAASNN